MVYSLICEGACNPTVKSLDAKVAQLRLDALVKRQEVHSSMRMPRLLLDGTQLFEAVRRLSYTPHVMMTDLEAKCADCGYVRQYGGVPVVTPMTVTV